MALIGRTVHDGPLLQVIGHEHPYFKPKNWRRYDVLIGGETYIAVRRAWFVGGKWFDGVKYIDIYAWVDPK